MHTRTWTHPYCRCSKWPQLAATQAVKHLEKFTTDVVFWQLFADGLQSDFQLINHLGLWLEPGVYGTFPAWLPRSDSPVSSNLESLGATASFQ